MHHLLALNTFHQFCVIVHVFFKKEGASYTVQCQVKPVSETVI